MIRIIIMFCIVLLTGCESVSDTVDSWFTQGPDGEQSQAEQVSESTGWLLPSPYRELTAALVAGFAGFWTARKSQKKPLERT